MRKKPRGTKYRNLYRRGRVVYYDRVVDGSRHRFSTKTDDWDEAAAVRDHYEAGVKLGILPLTTLSVPSFGEFAQRYLEEDTSHLAPTTRRDRHSYLREDGPLGFFKNVPIDEIDPPLLLRWWTAEIVPRELSIKTGQAYLDVISSVLGYAQDLGLIADNPVRIFRESLRRRSRTQRSRAESAPGRHIRPVSDPEKLSRLLRAARKESPRAYLLVLLLLDAGLRMGEALGLTWGGVSWGADDSDASRALHIFQSRPRGGSSGFTKSGRDRRVALSRRLRDALADHYSRQFEPGPQSLVLGSLDPASFRKRDWRRILKRARLETLSPKDLRDTYASWLLTAGINVGYVSRQLGHADISVTVRHYAKWCGGSEYRDPMRLEPGEVPADLLARLDDSPQIPLTTSNADPSGYLNDWDREGIGRVAGREVVGPPGFEPGTVRL